MKILTYTSLFPNAVDRSHGIFIRNRLLHFTRSHQHELQVIAPVPYFPSLKGFGRWSRLSQVPSREVEDGVPVFHPRYVVTPKVGMMFYGWNMFLGSLRTVKRVQSTFDFAVIDAHYLFPDGFAAVLLARRLGKPVIVSARGTDVHLYSRLRGIRRLLRFVLAEADAVIAVSQSLKDLILDLGVSQEKVRVIGNGIDVSLFYPGNRLEARRHLRLPEGATLLLSVAKIAEVKGIHRLVEGLSEVRRVRPEVHLVLVGKSTEPAYDRQVRGLVTRLGLDAVVHFAGPQPHATLRDWYNASDLFCLASSREGWPNVLLEAIACGKPVVASRAGGVPEVVSSESYGVLVDPGKPEGFTAAILSALDRTWDVDKLTSHARQHSWERVSQAQEQLFQQVASGPFESKGQLHRPKVAHTES